MEQINGDFCDFDPRLSQRMAQSDAARQLFALLEADSGDQLRSILEQAAAGDMKGAQSLLRQLQENQQAQQLLRQLREEANG